MPEAMAVVAERLNLVLVAHLDMLLARFHRGIHQDLVQGFLDIDLVQLRFGPADLGKLKNILNQQLHVIQIGLDATQIVLSTGAEFVATLFHQQRGHPTQSQDRISKIVRDDEKKGLQFLDSFFR